MLVDPEKLLSLADAAKRGPYTESMLRGHVRRGSLPVVIIGKNLFVREEEFRAFVARDQFGGSER